MEAKEPHDIFSILPVVTLVFRILPLWAQGQHWPQPRPCTSEGFLEGERQWIPFWRLGGRFGSITLLGRAAPQPLWAQLSGAALETPSGPLRLVGSCHTVPSAEVRPALSAGIASASALPVRPRVPLQG